VTRLLDVREVQVLHRGLARQPLGGRLDLAKQPSDIVRAIGGLVTQPQDMGPTDLLDLGLPVVQDFYFSLDPER